MRASKPNTRAQTRKTGMNQNVKQKETNGKVNGKSMTRENHENREHEEINKCYEEKKQGWTNVADVEAKLIKLENQYKRTKEESTKKKLRKLIDIYEKQAKQLNIKNAQQNKEITNKIDKEIHPIQEEDEKSNSDDNNTIMSDLTIKTTNSVHVNSTPSKNTKTKYNKSPRKKNGDNQNNQHNNTKLESLGKTRKANKGRQQITKTPTKTKKTMMITQDDGTIMSEATNNKNDNESKTQNEMRKETDEECKDVSVNMTDNISIMSECTIQQIKTPVKQDTKNEAMKEEQNTENQGDSQTKNTTPNENKDNTKNEIQEQKEEYQDDQETTLSEITNDINEENNQGKQEVNKKNESTKETRENTTDGKNQEVKNPYNTTKAKNSNRKKTNDRDGEEEEKPTYATATKRGTEENKRVSSNECNNTLTTNTKTIRIRFSFIGYESPESPRSIIRQILYDTMKCAKRIDKRAALAPWEDEAEKNTLNGDEINMIAENEIMQYIDMPPSERGIVAGEMHYGNGIRIKTNIDVDTFVERWNNSKYDKATNTTVENWKAVKRAEMQNHPKAYPIGYFAGTTERGFYDTVIKSLTKEFEDKIEISFQSIYQPGVSTRVWKLARQTADKQYKNANSKNHKMLKFAMAPTALTVFVGNQSVKTTIRKELIRRYGDSEGNEWATMEDGSKMKFVPILKGYVTDTEARNQLYEHLKLQATSKASEIKLDFPFQDLQEKKTYLGNKSFEQITHGIMMEGKEDIPIFKHITIKWPYENNQRRFEVAVANAGINEATKVLKGLKNTLIKRYGNQVRNHFIGGKTEKQWKIAPKKRNFTLFNEDWDDEIGEYIKKSNPKDKLSKVLIEGMEIIFNQGDKNDGKGAMLIKQETRKTKTTNKKRISQITMIPTLRRRRNK